MPFGLTSALVTFQRFMNFAFQLLFGTSICVLIDDFCIYSQQNVHCVEVGKGLQRLHALNGQLNPKKCHVAQTSVTLLGHVISEKGIEVDPSKIRDILALPGSIQWARELDSVEDERGEMSSDIPLDEIHTEYRDFRA